MMNHPDRTFSFQEIESEGDLVDAMFNHKWPLCYSFYHGKLLYLNDGESEEMPEYAVVTIDKTEGRFNVLGHEVGRIMPKSMTADEAPKYIRSLNAFMATENETLRLMAEPKWHHQCHLCGLEEE
jgi:hypothetical protein